MNRKQRRIAQAQGNFRPMIQLGGKDYTFEEAGALAIQAYKLGNPQAAVEIYNLIIAQAPSAEAYYNQGIILHDMKRSLEALACYDKAIALKPAYAEAYNNRGLALQSMNQPDDALASFGKAIALKPDLVQAYSNRGALLLEMRRYDDALASSEQALKIKSGQAEAYNNRGNIMSEMKRYDDALVCYDKAIELKPLMVEAHNNRGNILSEMRRFDEALASFDKTLALKSDLAEVHNNRGNVLQKMRRYDEAVASFDKAIALKPSYAEAHNNRGNALSEMKRYDASLLSLNRAIELNPNLAMAYSNRGDISRTMGRYDDAQANFAKAASLKPDIPYLIGDLLNAQMQLCNWQGMDATLNLLAKEIEAGRLPSPPFALLATPLSLSHQKQCAEAHIRTKYQAASSPLWKGERYAHERIRIGYFSSDFHTDHPVAHVLAELFERHDRSRFEVTAFSFGPATDDPLRKRLEKAFEHFMDVSAKSEMEIATMARNMEIDIAVDLNGLTSNARTGIFALRPAPVQVNFLGYPGSTGAGYIDYLIADATIIPQEHTPYYTERMAYLPHTYWVNDTQRAISEKTFTRQEMGLPEKGFVFCCFNKSYKFTPDAFDVWMRLLHKVEGSVLWLFGGNATAMNNLRAEAKARGVDEHRLVFTKRMDSMAEHLARHRCADLFLDTFYYNAHTTASDALWSGLPIVTCLGKAFAGRVGASLLRTVGLPELVTSSHAEYEALALDLATHPEKLSAIKAKLAQNRTTAPLFNTALFARNIEAVYMKMLKKAQGGEVPDHIYIGSGA